LKKTLRFAAFCIFLCGALAIAQQPDQQLDDQQLEEQFIQSHAENGDSHASGMRPELGPVVLGNPTQSVVTLRVGLYYSFTSTGAFSEFSTLHHPFADISNTAGDVHILDRSTGKQILAVSPGMIAHVTYTDGAGYNVSVDGVDLGTFGGPIFFRPTDVTNRFRVESIRRTFGTTQVPMYRGAIEIARGRITQSNRVNVVNVITLEDYVPGVVVNESIASFHIEALKAQAIAARGYAVANIGRFAASGYPFDIVDSSSSQVYRGVISEHVKALQASAETTGLVASYQGKIISALYSSSFGGYSENNEWIFNSPSTVFPGTNAVPYLRGIYDGDGIAPDFSSDAGIDAFWKVSQPNIYDDCARVGNRFSRWRIVLTGAQIKSRLTTGRYVLISGSLSGNITDVQLVTRMDASARYGIARITLTSGVVEVRGWDNLRNVLGRSAVSTPAMCAASNIAANFTLNNPSALEVTHNLDGTVNQVTAWGGGWGHNLGFSQYGSNGRAKAGQNFIQILKAYYTGVDIGSYPIDIGRQPGSGPPTLRQDFYAPNAKGTLVVRNANGMPGLRVHINGTYDLSFDAAALSAGTISTDLTPYLVPGVNTIQFNPVGNDGTATVTVTVD
jgi:SpoIID/LytB domain protein